MPWASIAIPVAASVVGGMINADAAGKAASAQSASSAQAIGEQRRQFDINQQNQKPFLNTGTAANKRLAYLLGIGTSGTKLTADDYRKQLLSQYTNKTPTIGGGDGFSSTFGSQIDEAGLNAAIQKKLAEQDASMAADEKDAQSDPMYGSLMRRFSQSDLNSDPVYQNGLKFGLDQGTGAINARGIATGSYDSGATLKALTRYATDYGATKANESYNRFNTDNTNIFNRLAGVSGAGQTAANAVNASGTNMANNVSELITGAGNANAAGIVGGANAWGNTLSGISGAANNYQNNQLLKQLLMRNSGGSGGGAGDYDPSLLAG